jgi:lambda family phage portal protein
LGVDSFVMTGEILSTAEWLTRPGRPFATAIQMISPDRLSNPNGIADDQNLRRGIRKDFYGKPYAYCIRESHPADQWSFNNYKWKEVAAEKPWGRKQVIHIIEQRMPDQSRGISEMVAVLKQMKMTKSFQEITLQNAVINASYAAAIESDLPTQQVFEALGANSTNPMDALAGYLSTYMGMTADYYEAAKNVSIDGAKIPHLFPGTKLHMQPIGTPGGVGSSFEESLLRHISAGLGLSYEQFSRDYTKTNYSSARASMNETWKFMQSRKKLVADRLATNIYMLWLEEAIGRGLIPLPPGKTRDWFYEPMVKEALCVCTWIGASRGQIDEKKETESAGLRMKLMLSTLEDECSRLGKDWRKVIVQISREDKLMKKYGLTRDAIAQALSGSAAPAAKSDQEDEETQDA